MPESTLIAGLIALLGIPGVAVLVTRALRIGTDPIGVNPRAVVYIVALALTALAGNLADLPAVVGDPSVLVGAWVVWAAATTRAAEALYQLLLTLMPGLQPADPDELSPL